MFPSSGSMDHASWCPYSYVFRFMLPHLTVGEIPCDSDSLGWQNAAFLLTKTTCTGIQRCSKLTKHPKHSACKTSFIISKHRKWFESIHHPISSFLLPSNSSKNIQHVQSWAHCPPGFFVHLRIHGRSNADGLCACGDHLENGEFLKKHQCV